MRACPYPCKGYTPGPGGPEQEVHLIGGEWYRGPRCPGAVVTEDPIVTDIVGDYQALQHWCHGQTLTWWNAQPAWWTAGIRETQRMVDHIRAEAFERND